MDENETNDIIKMLDDSIRRLKELNKDINEYPENYHTEGLGCLDDDELPGMYWEVFAEAFNCNPRHKPFGDNKLPVIKLSWGWTAGLSKEQKENMTEDVPQGEDSLVITMGGAMRLRDHLNLLIDKYGSDI